MRHPTDGTLRRLLDEPAGVADADREHIDRLSRLPFPARRPPRRTPWPPAPPSTSISPSTWTPPGSACRTRSLQARAGARLRRQPPDRWRTALRSPAVAVLSVVAVLLGAGAVAAADWVQIFRTERIAPVAITRTDLLELPGPLRVRRPPGDS